DGGGARCRDRRARMAHKGERRLRLLCDLAVAPGLCLAVGYLLKTRPATEPAADKVVPAAGLGLNLAVTTAHDQPLGRTGHCHVQQSAMLMFVFVHHCLPRPRDRRHVLVAAPGPNDAGWRARPVIG